MEWTQLKVAEAGWDLSLSQMNLLTERVYQKATGPKTFYFPILKPLLAVAAIAVLLFGLLLLWPKKPIEEQVVTLPGSSSAAKPDEYVENKPSKEEDSSKEQGTDKEETDPEKEQSSEGQKDTDNEEKLPVAGGEQEEKEEDETNKSMIHRFWETEKEMPYEEAVAIVKEKLENRPYETLTDKERMAFYQCISTNVYAKYAYYRDQYLDYPPDSSEDRYFENTDSPYFMVEIITTKDGVDLDLRKENPLVLEDEKYVIQDVLQPEKVEETTETSYKKHLLTNILHEEDGTLSSYEDFTKNSTLFELTLEPGTGRVVHVLTFKDVDIFKENLKKENFQEIIRYYLSFDSVTMFEITFHSGYVEGVLD